MQIAIAIVVIILIVALGLFARAVYNGSQWYFQRQDLSRRMADLLGED